MDNKIEQFHKELDEIDFGILDLVEKRIDKSRKLSGYKKERGFYMDRMDKRNETSMNSRLGKSDLSPSFVRNLFELVFEESRKSQDD